MPSPVPRDSRNAPYQPPAWLCAAGCQLKSQSCTRCCYMLLPCSPAALLHHPELCKRNCFFVVLRPRVRFPGSQQRPRCLAPEDQS